MSVDVEGLTAVAVILGLAVAGARLVTGRPARPGLVARWRTRRAEAAERREMSRMLRSVDVWVHDRLDQDRRDRQVMDVLDQPIGASQKDLPQDGAQ